MAGRFKDLFHTSLPPQASWITGGVLPKQGILLMGGPAKTRKTFLALDLAHAVAAGERLWGTDFEVPVKANVMYVEAEVGEYEFQRRIKMKYDVLGMDPPEGLTYVSKEKGLYLDTGPGIHKLSKYIEEFQPQVVIVDPISRCIMGDENDSTAIGGLFKRLDELMIDYKEEDLSIVLLHHHKKPSTDEAYDGLSMYNFRGSSRFFDAPDALISLQKTSERPGEWARLKTSWELRQAPAPEEAIVLAVLPGGLVRQVREEKAQTLPSVRKALQPGRARAIWGSKSA